MLLYYYSENPSKGSTKNTRQKKRLSSRDAVQYHTRDTKRLCQTRCAFLSAQSSEKKKKLIRTSVVFLLKPAITIEHGTHTNTRICRAEKKPQHTPNCSLSDFPSLNLMRSRKLPTRVRHRSTSLGLPITAAWSPYSCVTPSAHFSVGLTLTHLQTSHTVPCALKAYHLTRTPPPNERRANERKKRTHSRNKHCSTTDTDSLATS